MSMKFNLVDAKGRVIRTAEMTDSQAAKQNQYYTNKGADYRWILWQEAAAALEKGHMNIWDANGRKIGEVRNTGNGGQNTYDKNGQPAGKIRENGTFDNAGRKISWSKDPGLTIRDRK